MLIKRQIVQNAYCVNDIFEAAERAVKTLGAGPFFTIEHVPLSSCTYRGKPGVFDHSSAYGQCGDIMLEFVKQHNPDPSCVRDMYAEGEEGIHHCATRVEDYDKELQRYRDMGFEVANECVTSTGLPFAFVDTTKTLGHMIEVYPAKQQLLDFYKMVADAARNWDGSDPIRRLN